MFFTIRPTAVQIWRNGQSQTGGWVFVDPETGESEITEIQFGYYGGQDYVVGLSFNTLYTANGYTVVMHSTGQTQSSTHYTALRQWQITSPTHRDLAYPSFNVTPNMSASISGDSIVVPSGGCFLYLGGGSAFAYFRVDSIWFRYDAIRPARPENWAWASNVQQGAAVPVVDGKASYLTSQEWLDFSLRVFDFGLYTFKPISAGFPAPVAGSPMQARHANEARDIIAGLSPPLAPPAPVAAGQPITAAFINGLANSLNSIT